MKNASKLIIEKFPYLHEHINAHQNVLARQQVINDMDNQIEETFIELLWFFEDPNNNSFDLQVVYKTLNDDWLLFALEVIEVFFRNDLYLINKPLNSLIVTDDYVDQSGASRQLILNGLESYTQNKVATYIYRDTFPEPDLIISNKRYWKKSTISDYAKMENNET